MVGGRILYYVNLFKFVEFCFMPSHVVYPGESFHIR